VDTDEGARDEHSTVRILDLQQIVIYVEVDLMQPVDATKKPAR